MYDKNFNVLMDFIYNSEGGYNNDVHDYGGPTNFGITQKTYDNWNERHNKPKKDVKGITKEEAKEIYYYDYWIPSGANKIEDIREAYLLFDTEILCGHDRTKKLADKAKGNMYKLLDERRKFHIQRAENDKTQEKWLEGWLNRLDAIEYNMNLMIKKGICKPEYSNDVITPFDKGYQGAIKVDDIEKQPLDKIEALRNKYLYIQYKNGISPEGVPYEYTKKQEKQNNKKADLINDTDFENVSVNGRKWKDWTSKEKEDFIEGFDTNVFTKEGEKSRKKKLKVGDPDKDKGHWITTDKGQHLFIKNS